MLPIRILKLFSLQTALVASPSLAGAVFMRLTCVGHSDLNTGHNLQAFVLISISYPVGEKIPSINVLLSFFKLPLINEGQRESIWYDLAKNPSAHRIIRALRVNLIRVFEEGSSRL